MSTDQAGTTFPVGDGMRQPSPTPSLLRAPLIVVAMFLLALLALYPGATLRAQNAPITTPTVAPMVGATAAPAAPTVTAKADTVDGEVSDVVLKGKSLEVRYRNTGTVSTELVGELQVRSEDDELVASVPLVEAFRIDAGKQQTFKVAMPTLPPGKYTLYAVVDFGGRELTAAQAALEVRK